MKLIAPRLLVCVFYIYIYVHTYKRSFDRSSQYVAHSKSAYKHICFIDGACPASSIEGFAEAAQSAQSRHQPGSVWVMYEEGSGLAGYVARLARLATPKPAQVRASIAGALHDLPD